jgi:hypothetical protein
MVILSAHALEISRIERRKCLGRCTHSYRRLQKSLFGLLENLDSSLALESNFFSHLQSMIRPCPHADVLITAEHADGRDILFRGGTLQQQKTSAAIFLMGHQSACIIANSTQKYGGNEIESAITAALSDISDHQPGHSHFGSNLYDLDRPFQKRSPAWQPAGSQRQLDHAKGGVIVCRYF